MDLATFIKQHVTASQYEELPMLMRLTPYRTTVIQNRPQLMTQAEIVRLVEVINRPEVTNKTICERFQCGWDCLTKRQFDELINPVNTVSNG